MARKLDSYSFPDSKRTRYPWEDWLDGDIWEITQGEDFGTTASSMRSTIRQAAQERELQVKLSRPGDGPIVFQAVREYKREGPR